MEDIVGIDLGTTKSVVAIWRDHAPHIIPDPEGRTIVPSVVAFDQEQGTWQVGHSALDLARRGDNTAIEAIKRFMGRRFGDENIQESLQKRRFSYEVRMANNRDGIEVSIGKSFLKPEEVSAKILQKLKTNAEAFLGHEIRQAVISVPAYFHHLQRQSTHEAARLAGLEVKRILNEPTAACLAFGYTKLNQERKHIAVYDLGGGTFDISILEVGRGPFMVRSINGNTFLGGEDLNGFIVDAILARFDKSAATLQSHGLTHRYLRTIAEQMKIALSEQDSITLFLPVSPETQDTIHNIELTLTRAELEEIARPFIERTLEPCARVLYDAHLKPADIQEVLLVGGQTRMPAVRQAVHDFFGIVPDSSVHPEEVVALGAAVQAAILAGEAPGLKLGDVVPLSLGVNTRGGMSTLIPRNTPLPYEKSKIYSTFYDNQDSVEVLVYQGENELVAHNTKLGAFILPGIIPAPHLVPEIEIKFEVDIDGILHVMAQDLQTKIYKEITITDSVNLTREQIAERIQDAELHGTEYAAQRQQVDLQDEAERLTENLRLYLASQTGGTLSPETITSIQQTIAIPASVDIQDRLAQLQQCWQKLATNSQ